MPSASAASTSSGSKSPATGFYEADQMMEVDSRKSPMREAHLPSDPAFLSSSTHDRREPAANADFLDKELISSASRLSRLPSKVPSSLQTNTSSLSPVAIPAHTNTFTSNTSQDVHHFVNNSASLSTSTVPHPGQLTSPETNVSSFSQPLQHHVLTHPIRRPRTSANIFQSSTDLASHYGIPQILPPAPRITPRTTPIASNPSSPVIPDFQTLSNNYLNMLNNKSTETTVTASSAPNMLATTAPMGLDAPNPMTDTQLQELAEFIATSPAFRDQDIFDTYMNTPVVPELDDFGASPFETPYSDFLTTPLFADDPNYSPAGETPLFFADDSNYIPGAENYSLFPEVDQYSINVEHEASDKTNVDAALTNFDNLYTISPTTPALESFDTFTPAVAPTQSGNGHLISSTVASSSTTAAPSTSRRVKATGIRKGITPNNLLDEHAPTQPRKYTTPSATSRKEIPAVFARKRSRSTAFGEDEEDELDTLPPNPTEMDLIEQKRRQNTVAARRSRKRKLEQFQMLEKSLKEETKLKEIWKERAIVMSQMLRDHNVPLPDWPTDEQTLQGIQDEL